MGRTTALRRELKRTFLPWVQAKGFVVDSRDAPTFMRFRRSAGDEVHLFEIQWDKYGSPRFVINFGSCPAQGVEIRGAVCPPERLSVGWLARNGRLQPRRGAGTASWFRQDRAFLIRLFTQQELRSASEVVADLVRLFPELEAFWADGRIGPHLKEFALG